MTDRIPPADSMPVTFLLRSGEGHFSGREQLATAAIVEHDWEGKRS